MKYVTCVILWRPVRNEQNSILIYRAVYYTDLMLTIVVIPGYIGEGADWKVHGAWKTGKLQSHAQAKNMVLY
jgi:hypothetical protein